MAELLAELLLWIEDIKFWRRKKKRRKLEKEEGLPRKTMYHPVTVVFVIAGAIFILLTTVFSFFNASHSGIEETQKNMVAIQTILEEEKNTFGVYPEELKEIVRNNPLRKNIIFDYWKNAFVYTTNDSGTSYMLISKGGDHRLDTTDDIKVTN